MNKRLLGIGGAALAATGVTGGIYANNIRKRNNEMSKALQSLAPPEMTEEEREHFAYSIIKNSDEYYHLVKEAFMEVLKEST